MAPRIAQNIDGDWSLHYYVDSRYKSHTGTRLQCLTEASRLGFSTVTVGHGNDTDRVDVLLAQAQNAEKDHGSHLYRLQCFFRDLPVAGDEAVLAAFRSKVAAMSPKEKSDLTIAARVLDSILDPKADDGTVYVVSELGFDFDKDLPVVKDLEILDTCPQWDWESLGQVVRVANVNGGDSSPVEMPAENRGR